MSTIDFSKLLLSNTDFLKPFAVTLTHDQETAKDLVQETVYRAIVNKEKYQIGTNIKAWLYTIMRNIFINEYRRKSKQNVIFDKTPNEYLINSSSVQVDNSAESSMTEKEIWSAINLLPEIFKKPFLLYYNGYKYDDISKTLNEPLGTIKSRIHFARKLLKQYIQKRNSFGLN
jgi:RNA polymerase sigma factor (sigma-70 family)